MKTLPACGKPTEMLASPANLKIFINYFSNLFFSFQAVERCYTKIVSQKNIDDTLKKIVHERLKTVREKKTSMSTEPHKNIKR